MVRPDLKVGDTFIEGENTYRVLSIVPEGYTAEIVEDKKAKPVKKEEEIKELPFTTVEENKLDSFNKYTKTEINRLNNAELKSVCEQLDIEPGTGVEMKKAIIEKLGL